MKLNCLQENLKRGLAAVSHAIPAKTTMPVLGNILLATDGARLKLVGTDLEIAITSWIGAQIVEAGAVTVPARLLSDLVANLPNEPIALSLDPRTSTVKVECGRFTSHIKGIEAAEFPLIPTVSGVTPLITMPPDMLREAISQVAFAAATDTTRPVLTGVLMRFKGSELFMAAADGFRLATRRITLPTPASYDAEFIVPAVGLAELARITAEGALPISIVLAPGAAQALFHTDTMELVSRLVEGTFPDVERIVPTQHLSRVILDVAELSKAVKLAGLFASASQGVIRLTAEPGAGDAPGKLVLGANAPEVGDNTGEVDGVVGGAGGHIALNVRYLVELLGCVKTAQLALETQSPQSAGVFRPVGQDEYVHVIMPMSVNR